MRIKNYNDQGDKGFQVFDSEGVVQMTFFWSESESAAQEGYPSYNDVLKIFPRRMKEMGFKKKDTEKLLIEITKRFGKG